MSDRIILLNDDGVRTPDASFVSRLRAFDRDLCVSWSPMKRRWVIEQCIEHKGGEMHTNLCRKIYVWLCQDPEGDMVPLGDYVMNHLGEMRANSEKWGEGAQGLENFKRHVRNLDQSLKETRERKIQEINRDNAKDNKRQLEQVRTLMQRHNLTGPPQ
jgi:hypothetical protein